MSSKMIRRNSQASLFLIPAVAAALWLVGCAAGTAQNPAAPDAGLANQGAGQAAEAIEAGQGQAAVEFPHIHGLGFSADGRQLFVPAHDGLRLFSNGQWQIPDAAGHDYMGYAPADDGFYSSGHPHPSSGLVNPLGLVKSNDGGQTLTRLGFEGESDFHLMGVGYQ
ncbi:MAG: hypothetical protein ACRDHL_08850, partial [Candidatus Promineifilaceae bacterium]